MTKSFPGEFEQMVLLAVLQLDDEGYAIGIRRQLEERAGRAVSRGALYRTLDRLESKGFVEWEMEEAPPDRGGHPRRRFAVTKAGIESLKTSRAALFNLWDGLDGVLGNLRALGERRTVQRVGLILLTLVMVTVLFGALYRPVRCRHSDRRVRASRRPRPRQASRRPRWWRHPPQLQVHPQRPGRLWS